MSELQSRGRSIVVVSHDLDLIQRFCDRACLLVDGRVAAEGEAGEVAARYGRDGFRAEAAHAV
jgi:ABC-type polysaccharide/polyol phosphate transport system ATPase subunit